MNLAEILKDSNYKLSQFKSEEIDSLEQAIFLKQTKGGEVPFVTCLARNKAIKLTPEEVIRQLYLKVLTERYHYPMSQIAVEYGVNFGREVKRADIVVIDKDRPNTVYMIIELKKPKLKDGKDQLRSYCNATGAPIAVWTNGDQISYYQRKDPNYFEDITNIPNVHQTLADILQIRFTLEDLIANDKLRKEKKSLKTLIEEMEDEVLANAGVDVFEELFKLIFTKLYDEWKSGQGSNRSSRPLEFRNTGQTEAALKKKIQSLFDQAKQKWEGVFSDDAKISLTPSHLSVCVSSLENVKLFNSNLDVIDEAFEYLINQSSKGEKGQFFTPRYVIDLCVKMLNPKEDEYMIDPAAGSSGYPVHTMFHVWKQILQDEGIAASHLFTMENKPYRCQQYVEEKIFAIDFDEKAVRVARTLNLIAGDGQTNVLHLNTLDYELWDEVTEQEDWQDVYFEGFKRLKKLRKTKDGYREFKFDVLMANPPFAGDIKEPRMIARYDLAKKPNGHWQTKVGRDILFIERNLDFLKPGGRMAIVLPQGRFNNSSDKTIRDYIAERCRILAVVGLHSNTFKPHTGTKTSVLFVQKWNDSPEAGALCPTVDDYNIFFATMRKSGKDNSGDKIWRRVYPSSTSPPEEEESVLDPPAPVERVVGAEGDFLQDFHGHLVLDHDLYNHEGLTENGIAEAFIEFAKKENLSFFESSPSVAPFDPRNYQQLMDGLEAVEAKLGELERTHRIDSEFFKIEHIKIASLLKRRNAQSLTNLVRVSDGNHMKISENFTDTGIPYYRGQDIHQFFVEQSSPIFIDENTYNLPQMRRCHLKKGDVLLSIVGSIGGVSYVSTNNLATCNCKLAILRPKTIKPEYLAIYLKSRFGQSQVERFTRGAVQMGLILEDMDQLVIPKLSSDFENFIFLIAEQVKSYLKQAELEYRNAEDLLLSELGLKDWQPTEENVAVKSFASSFGVSDRLDAEYYQPKQQKVMSVMRQSGLCIEDIADLAKRRFQPERQGTFNYIEIGNVSGEGFVNSEVVAMEDAPSRAQWIVQADDVITSTVRPIRRLTALIEQVQNNCICSSGFAVLKPSKVESEVLLVYLRLPVICEILDLHTTASMYPAISTEDLLNIPITLPDTSIRQKITEKVRASRKAREQSKQLLETAKTGVERAIEMDEAEAMSWMNQQLEALGVDLE